MPANNQQIDDGGWRIEFSGCLPALLGYLFLGLGWFFLLLLLERDVRQGQSIERAEWARRWRQLRRRPLQEDQDIDGL